MSVIPAGNSVFMALSYKGGTVFLQVILQTKGPVGYSLYFSE